MTNDETLNNDKSQNKSGDGVSTIQPNASTPSPLGTVSPLVQQVNLDPDANKRQARIVLLDSLAQIPVFCGSNPNYTVKNFESKFFEWSNFLLWPKSDCLFAVRQRLAGKAQQTFDTYRDQINSVEDLFRILKERFESKEDPAQILNEFWSFKQTEELTVTEFVALAKQKVKKILKCQNFPKDLWDKTETDWLMSMLLINLRSELRRAVIARNPTTLEQLIDIATWEEKSIVATKPGWEGKQEFLATASGESTQNNIQLGQFSDLLTQLTQQMSNLNKKMERLEEKERNNDRQRKYRLNVTCFNCGKKGHYKRDCFKKIENMGGTDQNQPRRHHAVSNENSGARFKAKNPLNYQDDPLN